ncbi:MAG: hypothetical protein KME22_12435 [Hassallia sp. WJT32-NPBG1]|nr:hypothetical protein [Hassallia sp. WJT32-NPBG1]
MTTYTKRIQSRLNRMGIKKSLAEIREVYTSIVNDKDNPTEEEITSVVESFMTAIAAIETTETASELTTIQSSDEQQSPQSEKVTNNPIQPVSATQAELDGVDEILSQESGEVVEASSIVFNTEQKQDLITTQASVLGIELSEVEVADLASTVGDKFTDYAEFIREVTSAIKTYADHHYDSLEQSIEDTHKDLKNHFTYRERQLNQKFVEGLGNVKTALEVSQSNLKRTKTAILSRLNIKGA